MFFLTRPAQGWVPKPTVRCLPSSSHTLFRSSFGFEASSTASLKPPSRLVGEARLPRALRLPSSSGFAVKQIVSRSSFGFEASSVASVDPPSKPLGEGWRWGLRSEQRSCHQTSESVVCFSLQDQRRAGFQSPPTFGGQLYKCVFPLSCESALLRLRLQASWRRLARVSVSVESVVFP